MSVWLGVFALDSGNLQVFLKGVRYQVGSFPLQEVIKWRPSDLALAPTEAIQHEL